MAKFSLNTIVLRSVSFVYKPIFQTYLIVTRMNKLSYIKDSHLNDSAIDIC